MMPRSDGLRKPPLPDESRDLRIRFAAGDHDAFTYVWSHAPGLLRPIIRRFTDDDEDISDILQEIAMRAYIKCFQLRHDGTVWGWLAKIAFGVCTDSRELQTRAADALKRLLIARGDVDESGLAESDADGFVLNSTLTAHDLRAAVEQLSEQQKAVIHLRFFADMSFREIAAALHITESTARGTSRNALARLRELLCKL